MDQRDVLIRTIIGEAAGEGPQGWAAVAHVVRNRARDERWPNSIGAVALQPKQFSAWNDGAGGNHLVRKYGPGDPVYERIGAVVDQVMRGEIQDMTGGATHYYSPAGMDALVNEGSQSNRIPRWLEQENQRRGGQTVRIGGHIFTGRADGTEAPQGYGVAGAISPPIAAAGFTQQQIADAFKAVPEQQGQPLYDPQPNAPELAPLAPVEPYKPDSDPLANAMRAFQTHQQRRKGLLSWL